ncbi:MAG: hypothetical protein M1817_002434 [Caeruleum heppii]|nr:MAG: hypothetical protein M1817_002434 [Caeruleum heppii]
MDIADDVKGSTADSSPAAQETKLVLRQASSCPSQTSDQPLDREIIDEAGDLLVQTSSKEFLVSSKILTLASPIFKAMFGSGFLEGNLDRSAQHPLELPLSDDSPDAWAVLFHILHFSSKRKFLMPDVDLHLEIAQLSDKYDCMASVQAESKQWLRSRSGTDYESSILWKLTTITFLLDHTEEFANFTAKLASTLSAAELDDATLATVLPGSLKGTLQVLPAPK